MHDPEPPAPRSLLYVVKRLELAIRAHLDAMLADSGVTTLQYTALTVLEHSDAISAAELARRSFVTPQAMADMTRALEGRGLITRAPHPTNGRERTVHLTDAGARLLQRYAAAADAIAEQMTADLTSREVQALQHTLSLAWSTLDQGRRERGRAG